MIGYTTKEITFELQINISYHVYSIQKFKVQMVGVSKYMAYPHFIFFEQGSVSLILTLVGQFQSLNYLES